MKLFAMFLIWLGNTIMPVEKPPECQHLFTEYINPRSPLPDRNGNVIALLIIDGIRCAKCGKMKVEGGE